MSYDDAKLLDTLDDIRRVMEEIRDRLPALPIFAEPVQWHSIRNDAGTCPGCGKRRGGLSIPRMGIREMGNFCMCAVATQCSTSSDKT